jgi:hypothetical protein
MEMRGIFTEFDSENYVKDQGGDGRLALIWTKDVDLRCIFESKLHFNF